MTPPDKPIAARPRVGLAARRRRYQGRSDIIIRPRVAHLNANSPFHMQLSFRRGEEAAREALPLIEEMLRGQTPLR